MKVIKGLEEEVPVVNGINEVDGSSEEVCVINERPRLSMRTTVSAPMIQSVVSPVYEEIGETYPTPSRSAPAPPNSQQPLKQDKVCIACLY